jgi:hypothetical protein
MWAGYAGTYFWVDPKEEIVGIYMTQAPSPIRAYYRKMFKGLVYQALVDWKPCLQAHCKHARPRLLAASLFNIRTDIGGFFLNLQTGTALGLTVPPSLLGHADEMISVGWCCRSAIELVGMAATTRAALEMTLSQLLRKFCISIKVLLRSSDRGARSPGAGLSRE